MTADRIAQDYITDPKTGDKIHISTVRLPFMHHNGNYETMIFGGALDEYQERYYTSDDAIEGHKEAVKAVYESFNKEIGDNQNVIS